MEEKEEENDDDDGDGGGDNEQTVTHVSGRAEGFGVTIWKRLETLCPACVITLAHLFFRASV